VRSSSENELLFAETSLNDARRARRRAPSRARQIALCAVISELSKRFMADLVAERLVHARTSASLARWLVSVHDDGGCD
jgi:hypothetical protein